MVPTKPADAPLFELSGTGPHVDVHGEAPRDDKRDTTGITTPVGLDERPAISAP